MADLLAAHEEDVQHTGAGDGGEGHETAQNRSGGGADAQARDEGFQTQRDTARGSYGEAVGFNDLAGGERGGLVGVGEVDGDVERLVGDLPACRSGCSKAGREHAGGDDQVGENEGGHAEGQQDGFAGV